MPSNVPKVGPGAREASADARRGRAVGRPARVRAPLPSWPPLVKDFYRDTLASGQTEFWEPSDFALLRVACDILAEAKTSGLAAMYAHFISLSRDLMVSETWRRRAYVELVKTVDEDAGESASDRMRRLLSVVPSGG